jgi:hypothetical protein
LIGWLLSARWCPFGLAAFTERPVSVDADEPTVLVRPSLLVLVINGNGQTNDLMRRRTPVKANRVPPEIGVICVICAIRLLRKELRRAQTEPSALAYASCW